MKLAQVVALVGLGVLIGGFAATRGESQQVSAQVSTSTGVFTVGERIEIRPVAGFANQDLYCRAGDELISPVQRTSTGLVEHAANRVGNTEMIAVDGLQESNDS